MRCRCSDSRRPAELQAYPEADVSEFPPDAYDRERTYFGTKLITTGIIVNRQAADEAPIVEGSAEARREGAGRRCRAPCIRARRRSTWRRCNPIPRSARTITRRSPRMAPLRCVAMAPCSNSVAGGQKMYGIIVEFMALNAKAKGSPVDFVFPDEGVSIVTEPTAILRGTKNPEAARAFVDVPAVEGGPGACRRRRATFRRARTSSRRPDSPTCRRCGSCPSTSPLS